jgi:hypothetical protein
MKIFISILLFINPIIYCLSQGSGNSISFNGSNNYINVGSNLVLSNSFTITFWVKTTNDNAMSILSYGSSNLTSPHVFIGIGNNWTGSITNELITISKINGGASNFACTSADRSVLFDGSWHHVGITFDGVNNYSFYIDGIFYPTVVGQLFAGYNLDGISSNYGYIGTRQFNSAFSTYFNGQLDELTIWNTPLSMNSIRDWMCKKITSAHPNYVNLTRYYNFDEGTGNTLTDNSTSALDGTLMNSPNWIVSGAPIGDVSDWISNVNIGDFVNLSHINGDNLTATLTSGSAPLMQIYLVNEEPNVTSPPLPFDQLSQSNYFGVKVFQGSSPVYSIEYNYDGHPGITIENNLGIASRNNNAVVNWTYESSSVLDVLNTTLLLENQSGTEFILGSTGTNILPIELIEFDAFIEDDIVLLNWKTASESNNDYFTIERSQDGLNWIALLNIKGAGNSSETISYQTMDHNAFLGVNYYRLKQTDYDGRFDYSKTTSVTFNSHRDNSLHVYPNPGTSI